MGNTIQVPKILPGDEVQQMLNGKILEPSYIVFSTSKEGIQLLNQIWYPAKDFVCVQNKGKTVFFKKISEYFTRRFFKIFFKKIF
jgi:hypothetical protein